MSSVFQPNHGISHLRHQSSATDDRARIVGSTVLSSPQVRELGDEFGRVNTVQAGQPRNLGSIPRRSKCSYFSQSVQAGNGADPVPTERTTEAFSARAKAAGT